MMRSLYNKVRVGYRLVRFEARHGVRAALRAAGSVAAAALGRRAALDPYRDRDGRLPGKPPRSVEHLILGISRYLLSQGKIADAAEVLDRAHEMYPSHRRIAAAHVVVAGERTVLSGRWDPPPIGERSFDAVAGRVLHVVGKSLPHSTAGYTVRTQEIARCQRAVGFDPRVITKLAFPQSEGMRLKTLVETVDGIDYHRLSGRRPRPWDERLDAHLAGLAGVVESLRPSLLHAHSDFENGLLALALRDRYGIPVVYEVRGFWEETWLSKDPQRTRAAERYRWRREREIDVMTRADHVVTLSSAMKDRIIGDGVDGASVTIVPNAVEPESFPASQGRDPALAASLGIGQTDFVVGYVSGLVAYEGVDILIDSVAELAKRGRSVRALIVGDGEDAATLREHAAAVGAAGLVTFTGPVPHDSVGAYYSLMDVFVVPRRDLPVTRLVTPLKPFEALSAGLPVVVANLPALMPIVGESGAATAFTADDADSLADVIDDLRADSARLSELGRRGAEWVRATHTWQHNARRYTTIYHQLGVEPIPS